MTTTDTQLATAGERAAAAGLGMRIYRFLKAVPTWAGG